MDVHFGVIRDRAGILSALTESRSSHRQLAVCYNKDDKLLVKICTVIDLNDNDAEGTVVLRSPSEEEGDTVIPLDHIQSIYPIRDFAG